MKIDLEDIDAWEAQVADTEARRVLGILLSVARAEQSAGSASEILGPVLRRLSRAQRESVAALLVELARRPGACDQQEGWGRPAPDSGRW